MIDTAFCEAMRPNAYFINTSRGSIVDEAALLKAIREKGVRAGLDVYHNEPGPSDKAFDSEIAREPGVLRHAPHRRLHRPSPTGYRRRDGTRHQ